MLNFPCAYRSPGPVHARTIGNDHGRVDIIASYGF